MPWRGPEYEGEFPSLGHDVVAWIESYLCHGPGDVAGQPIELDDEFYSFVVRCYRLDEEGRRVYRRAFLSRAKGRAKSELAGMLGCAELLGPVRFAGWDANGEPVGAPVRDPYVRCLATEEGQSSNTYGNCAAMLDHLKSAHGREFPVIELGRSAQTSTRILVSGGGQLVPSTASGTSKDGGKETFAVFDETHLFTTPELHRMHTTVRRNLRKRLTAEPWGLETSTMYSPGEDSVAEATHAYAQTITEGKARETGLLFDHRQAPPETDLADRKSLLAGLKAAYGPFGDHMDLDGIMAEIWDPQTDPNESRRYWLNQPTAATDAWLTPAQVESVATVDTPVADGDAIALGFDGSRQRDHKVADSTALVGCRISDGHLFLIPWHDGHAIWEQPHGPAGRDWQVPTHEVDGAVAWAFEHYRVIGFYCDPARWESYVDHWTAKYGPRLLTRASRKQPLQWWMTGGRAVSVVEATRRLHSAIVDREITVDAGSGALLRHLTNARRRVSSSGVQIAKEHPVSTRKIDAAVAAILATRARGDAVAHGYGGARKNKARRAVGF